jgi:hypothetical protein
MKSAVSACRSYGLAVLGILAAGVAIGQSAAPAAAASLGTLEYGPTLYYPQGCAHNGSTVACTFVFVHQAETASIRAGVAGSQLTGIQLVDDAHVPHNPNNAYFVDRYGMRQHVLSVNRGDQGTMVVEFPLVDSRVGTGEFHLGTQVLGGIPVGQGGAAGAPGAPNALAPANGQAADPAANLREASAAPTGCNTPQMANSAACKLNAKIGSAQSTATSTATAVAAPVNSIKQLGDAFGGLFKKPAPATPAPAPAAAQPAAQQ